MLSHLGLAIAKDNRELKDNSNVETFIWQKIDFFRSNFLQIQFERLRWVAWNELFKQNLSSLNFTIFNGSVDAFGPGEPGSNPGWSAVIEFKLIFVWNEK